MLGPFVVSRYMIDLRSILLSVIDVHDPGFRFFPIAMCMLDSLMFAFMLPSHSMRRIVLW